MKSKIIPNPISAAINSFLRKINYRRAVNQIMLFIPIPVITDQLKRLNFHRDIFVIDSSYFYEAQTGYTFFSAWSRWKIDNLKRIKDINKELNIRFSMLALDDMVEINLHHRFRMLFHE